jgi:hypothetical protein
LPNDKKAFIVYKKAFHESGNSESHKSVSPKVLGCINEALKWTKYLHVRHLAWLFSSKAFQLSYDESISNIDKVSHIDRALEYKADLTDKELAWLYHEKAVKEYFLKASRSEMLRHIDNALEYKRELKDKDKAWLFYLKAFQMEKVSNSKSELMICINDALEYRHDLTNNQYHWLTDKAKELKE